MSVFIQIPKRNGRAFPYQKGTFSFFKRSGSGPNPTFSKIQYFPEDGPSSHPQIILASSGMWYNLRPYCNGTGMSLFGRGDNESCSHFVLGKRIYGSDMLMNDTDVTTARPQQFWRQYHQHFGVPPWGWYSWGRRLQGTATIKEYDFYLFSWID